MHYKAKKPPVGTGRQSGISNISGSVRFMQVSWQISRMGEIMLMSADASVYHVMQSEMRVMELIVCAKSGRLAVNLENRPKEPWIAVNTVSVRCRNRTAADCAAC